MKKNETDLDNIVYNVVQKSNDKIETSIWPAKFLELKINSFLKNDGDILTITSHRVGKQYSKPNQENIAISNQFEEIIKKQI